MPSRCATGWASGCWPCRRWTASMCSAAKLLRGTSAAMCSRPTSAQITGWRKSDSQVAAFEFSHIASSVCRPHGRPAHVGVIGVALFREQPPVPQPAPAITPGAPYRQRRDNAWASGARLREEPASPAAAGVCRCPRPESHQPNLCLQLRLIGDSNQPIPSFTPSLKKSATY